MEKTHISLKKIGLPFKGFVYIESNTVYTPLFSYSPEAETVRGYIADIIAERRVKAVFNEENDCATPAELAKRIRTAATLPTVLFLDEFCK